MAENHETAVGSDATEDESVQINVNEQVHDEGADAGLKNPGSKNLQTHGPELHQPRAWKWADLEERQVTKEMEDVFLAMQLRKKKRQLYGPVKISTRSTRVQMFFAACLIIFVLGAVLFSLQRTDNNGPWSEETITLTMKQVAIIATVFTLAFAFFLLFSVTRFMLMIRFMILWAAVTVAISLFAYGNANPFAPVWLGIIFVIIEAVTFLSFVWNDYGYPAMIGSNWFRNGVGAAKFWRLESNRPWSMTYSSFFYRLGKRRSCMYIGAKNSMGLPHGYGRWIDDSKYGEALTGWWENGRPRGPFLSREYGSGTMFGQVTVAFYMATDDDFDETRFFPTNLKESRCGVATVECCILGQFFSHLPCARLFRKPLNCMVQGFEEEKQSVSSIGTHGAADVVPEKSHYTIKECCEELLQIATQKDRDEGSIVISTDERGHLLVDDHELDHVEKGNDVNSDSSSSFRANREQITVYVEYEHDDHEGIRSKTGIVSKQSSGSRMGSLSSKFVEKKPSLLSRNQLSARTFFAFAEGTISERRILVPVEENDEEEEADDSAVIQTPPDIKRLPQGNGEPEGVELVVKHSNATQKNEAGTSALRDSFSNENDLRQHSTSIPKEAAESDIRKKRTGKPRLVVPNWSPSIEAEAIIYIPGYNSSLKHSCETFGQFMGMAGLSTNLKPFVYAWPCGSMFSYRYASEIACADRSRKHFVKLLRGIEQAGIKKVHLMSHSLGVQTLLSIFRNCEDGSRSEVSICFKLVDDFQIDEEEDADSSLICKSITMLNPDFPVDPFVEHAFKSIRQLCSHITILGDRGDQALYYSEICNGGMNFVGRKQPSFLDSKEKKSGYNKQLVIGKSIDQLFFPASSNEYDEIDSRLLFRGLEKSADAWHESSHDLKRSFVMRKWLDVDIIDATTLDSNIQSLRHSYFNLNNSLIKDLADILTTGKRAFDRRALLFREGNIFSYASAPAHVVNG